MFLYSFFIACLSILLSADEYYQNVIKTAKDFGLNKEDIKDSIYYESSNLKSIGFDIYKREQFLDIQAADAFYKMKEAALKDSIKLEFVSAFRSFEYQKQIINRKLKKGYSIDFILNENTLPGFSEHHTGNAIDFISSDNNYKLNQDFEKSKEFKWLMKNASNYEFYLSYPKNNNRGIKYEPWHWIYKKND